MNYYKTIHGIKLDHKMIDQATLFVTGAGDGRISIQDAERLFKSVIDGGVNTEVEKATIDYLFKNFEWTAKAKEWFEDELEKWEKNRTPVFISLEELSKLHFTTKDVYSEPASREARRHALEIATNETNQDHDQIGLWIRLSNGSTVEVFSNFIEVAGDYVELKGGHIVPVKAIEKVEI